MRPDCPVYVTLAETATRLRMSRTALFNLIRRDPQFPARYRFGGKRLCVRLTDLEAYEAQRAVVSRPEDPPAVEKFPPRPTRGGN